VLIAIPKFDRIHINQLERSLLKFWLCV
jgi:hypothetical protein